MKRFAVLAVASILTFVMFWYTARFLGELIEALSRLGTPSHYNVTRILVRKS